MYEALRRFLAAPTRRLFENLSPRGREGFEPFIAGLDVSGVDARFFFGTAQAADWYYPIKPYAKLEYEWVLRNVAIRGKSIIDGGAHHGHYSVVLATGAQGACRLISVDPIAVNCALIEVNLLLNGFTPEIAEVAISDRDGEVLFAPTSNGRIVKRNGIRVPARSLTSILPEADVVKLDIEGGEFAIIGDALETMPDVSAWIVEVHPVEGESPEELVRILAERYEVFWVNRVENRVEPYPWGTEWRTHTTVFGLR